MKLYLLDKARGYKCHDWRETETIRDLLLVVKDGAMLV